MFGDLSVNWALRSRPISDQLHAACKCDDFGVAFERKCYMSSVFLPLRLSNKWRACVVGVVFVTRVLRTRTSSICIVE